MRIPHRIESALVRYAAAAMSNSGRAASLLVFIFHRVLPEPDPLLPDEPDARDFAAQIALMGSAFSVMPLTDAVRRLTAGSLPRRAASITFDDGYANNCEVARPILAAKGLPATVFVAPGFLDGGRMFNDTVVDAIRQAPRDIDLRSLGLATYRFSDASSRVEAIRQILHALRLLGPTERAQKADAIAAMLGVHEAPGPMLTTQQLLTLHRSGIEIGAHTLTHPILTTVPSDVARVEIGESKRRLEQIIGASVRAFAYPNGRPGADYTAEHVAMVKDAGFDVAVSTAWGAASSTSAPLQIPRVAAWDRQPLLYGARIVKAYRQTQFAAA